MRLAPPADNFAMRFAALTDARDAAATALRRFPLALACAGIAALISDWLVFSESKNTTVPAVLFAATLGIPVFFALALRREQGAAGAPAPADHRRWWSETIALAGLVMFAWLWPHASGDVQIRSYIQLSLFAHALAASLPFLAGRESNGFWQYNRTLLMRLIVASVFAGVLQAGLQGALLSLKPLFGISVSGKSFWLLSSTIYFVFHPLFFLAGIPRDLGELDRRHDYPPVIRVFAQFILVPLVAVYQALLSAYLVRVIFTGQWPSGLIGWLVSAEATFGVLALLLIHPVRDREGNQWVRTFARWFYVALLPSLVMLGLAIGKRIGQYGVTEDRYFVVALSLWLAAISVYFIRKREGDIRWIPITLGVLAVVTLFGPWSAYSISRASQVARLVRIVRTHDLRVDASPQGRTRDLPFKTAKELSSVLDYLFGTHGPRSVTAVLGAAAVDSTDLDRQKPGQAVSDAARHVMRRLGLAYVTRWEDEPSNAFSFSAPYRAERNAERVPDFDYHVRIEYQLPFAFRAEGRRLVLRSVGALRVLRLEEGGEIICTFPFDHAVEAGRSSQAPSDSGSGLLRVEGVPVRGRGLLLLSAISGDDRDSLHITNLQGDLFFTPR